MPINVHVEAARVPSQLLGELFIEKGLITVEELADAIADQKENGKRLGEILVQKGYVSGPSLTKVLAEQLGVEVEQQKGFGSGLWSAIERRHLFSRPGVEDAQPAEPPEAADREPQLALVDELFADEDPGAGPAMSTEDTLAAELESLHQQVAFAAERLDEERSSHDGTRRLLEEARAEVETLSRQDDGQEALALVEAHEATIDSLRSEVAQRDEQLAASANAVAALEAQASRREAELSDVRDRLEGSQSATAVLTSQVDELRSELGRRDAVEAALETDLASLRETAAEQEQALAHEIENRTALETQLADASASHDAIAARFEEERASHSAVREKLARLEARVAELEPLGDRLTTAVGELAESRTELEEVSARLLEAKTRLGVRDLSAADTSRHLVFMPGEGAYGLVELSGPAPDAGALAEIDGQTFRVLRVARSPLPADRRRCAYVEAA